MLLNFYPIINFLSKFLRTQILSNFFNTLYVFHFRAKRAAWRWARDRSGIVSRWTWLLAQISDLEYRIRQHHELHQQIKQNKGAVTFEDQPQQPSQLNNKSDIMSGIIEQPSHMSVNGYRGTLPGNSKLPSLDGNLNNGAFDTTDNTASATHGSCRTRAFQRNGFRKRKLLQTTNLHTISKKAARPRLV